MPSTQTLEEQTEIPRLKREVRELLQEVPNGKYYLLSFFLRALINEAGDVTPDEAFLMDITQSYGYGLLNPTNLRDSVEHYLDNLADTAKYASQFAKRHPELMKD